MAAERRAFCHIRLAHASKKFPIGNKLQQNRLARHLCSRSGTAELDRLAELDFAAYEDAPVQQRLDDPAVEKPYRNIGPSLGNGFAFGNGGCF